MNTPHDFTGSSRASSQKQSPVFTPPTPEDIELNGQTSRAFKNSSTLPNLPENNPRQQLAVASTNPPTLNLTYSHSSTMNGTSPLSQPSDSSSVREPQHSTNMHLPSSTSGPSRHHDGYELDVFRLVSVTPVSTRPFSRLIDIGVSNDSISQSLKAFDLTYDNTGLIHDSILVDSEPQVLDQDWSVSSPMPNPVGIIRESEPDNPEAWMARCILACVTHERGRFEDAQMLLNQAAQIFERMLQKQHQQLLTAINLLASIIGALGKNSSAKMLLNHTFEVCGAQLGPGSPIALTSQWLTALLSKEFDTCKIDEAALRQVHETFKTSIGPRHPYTLASLYNLAWQLTFQGKHEEAEARLHELLPASEAVLGTEHPQTLSCLNTLARITRHLGKLDTAGAMILEVLSRSLKALGEEHPYTLETRRRLGLLYEEQGREQEYEEILWKVLRGRMRAMGTQHMYTQGSLDDLEAFLKKRNRHEEAARLRAEVNASTDSDESIDPLRAF